MNWLLGEVVGAIGLIVTLVFLAMEMRLKSNPRIIKTWSNFR